MTSVKLPALKLALATSIALTGLAVITPTASAECHKVEIIDCGDINALDCKVVGTKTVCSGGDTPVTTPAKPVLTIGPPAPPKKPPPTTKATVRATAGILQ